MKYEMFMAMLPSHRVLLMNPQCAAAPETSAVREAVRVKKQTFVISVSSLAFFQRN